MMTKEQAFIVAILSLISLVPALIALYHAYENVDLESMEHFLYTTAPLDIRSSKISAAIGYHLALVPIAVYMEYYLSEASPLLQTKYHIYTIFGLGYMLIVGAMTFLLGQLQHDSATAVQQGTLTPQQMASQVTTVAIVTDAVQTGIRQIFGGLCASVWFGGVGWTLFQNRKTRSFSSLTMLLSFLTFCWAINAIFYEHQFVHMCTVAIGILQPLWLVWAGIDILRGDGIGHPMKFE